MSKISLGILKELSFARFQSMHSVPISLGTKEKHEEKLGSMGHDVLHHIRTVISILTRFRIVDAHYFSNFSTKLII